MELVIWGLLIGLVGMVWLLVAAAVQDKESRDEGRGDLKQRRVRAAA